ncbi:MAG: DUF4388 domain-containing protein [Methanomicrobiales archaeon]|nr:DUF4388 domain-containing protein [Methanomicrobiales archaeon]
MQLPRGKFREIVRGVPLSPLLLELNEVQYTGILKLTWDTTTCTLVFQNGLVILAEYPPRTGDGAWEAVTRLGDQAVGAILSDLDAVQMKLVTEFNAPCLLSVPATPGRGSGGPKKVAVLARTDVAPQKQGPGPVPAAAPGARRPEAGLFPPQPPQPVRQEPEKGKKLPVFPVPPAAPSGRTGAPAPQSAPPATPPVGPREGKASAGPSAEYREGGTTPEPEPFHKGMDPATLANLEMAALDDMDVDHIATKIRKNARGIVKKLHLGHLMTEKDE